MGPLGGGGVIAVASLDRMDSYGLGGGEQIGQYSTPRPLQDFTLKNAETEPTESNIG